MPLLPRRTKSDFDKSNLKFDTREPNIPPNPPQKIKMNRWADEKVQNAQSEANKKANAELTLKIQKLQADQRDLQEREATISAREQAAQDTEMAAQQKVDQVVELYEQELARFEAEISAMQSSKNNAQQAFKRIKQKSVKES